MSKLTLLEIVQDILNDLEADEVNSINDTIESLQIAQIVKTTYYNIIDGRDFAHLFSLFQLNSSTDNEKPNYMKLPENIIDISWIKYNTKSITDTKNNYVEIKYKTPKEFLSIVDSRISDDSRITIITDFSGIPLNIFNERPPTYFTSFDDENIVFDAWDSEIDDTLQANKVQAYGKRRPEFILEDTFVPDLPIQMFSYLLSEAKSTSFVVTKQTTNPKAEQNAISQRRRMSQEAWRIKNGITYPNYGRK